MGKISWKGAALAAPVPPALVTCRYGDIENVFTVAWTGIVNTIPPKTYISVRKERFSYNLIEESGVFAINFAPSEMARAVDFCGVKSGKNTDKFKEAHLTKAVASKIDVPIIEECPLSLECVVTDKIELGSHTMFLADIVAVDVDEKLVDSEGKLHLERAHLLAYAHGDYFSLGKKTGSFGFSVRKRKSAKRRKSVR